MILCRRKLIETKQRLRDVESQLRILKIKYGVFKGEPPNVQDLTDLRVETKTVTTTTTVDCYVAEPDGYIIDTAKIGATPYVNKAW